MSEDRALLSERARALLLSFAISHNASDFCRFITVVALRDFGAVSALMVRVEKDASPRIVGQYGQPKPENDSRLPNTAQFKAIKKAIARQAVVALERLDDKSEIPGGFLALPFSPTGDVPGALGLTFRRDLSEIHIPEAELELMQLLSELIAVNSLPRIRATGLLSKLYFDTENLEDISSITPRQLSVLDQMAIGKTNGQIARDLNLSESTIKQESVRIFRILGVNTRQRAVSVGKEMGII
jgi:DNA-binding CsgD family transcriptional regulator